MLTESKTECHFSFWVLTNLLNEKCACVHVGVHVCARAYLCVCVRPCACVYFCVNEQRKNRERINLIIVTWKVVIEEDGGLG